MQNDIFCNCKNAQIRDKTILSDSISNFLDFFIFQRLNSFKEDKEEVYQNDSGSDDHQNDSGSDGHQNDYELESPASSPEPKNLENLVFLKQALLATEQEIIG